MRRRLTEAIRESESRAAWCTLTLPLNRAARRAARPCRSELSLTVDFKASVLSLGIVLHSEFFWRSQGIRAANSGLRKV